MKQVIFLLGLVTIFAVASTAQSGTAKVDFSVNGVGLGTRSYREIIAKLGKPTNIVESGEDECTGGISRSLQYDGLEIDLSVDKNDSDKVDIVKVTVTSSKWRLGSGVRFGQTKNAVRARLGRPYTGEKAEPNELSYEVLEKYGPGGVDLTFVRNRLSKIEVVITTC